MHWHDPNIQPVRVAHFFRFGTANKSQGLFNYASLSLFSSA